MVYGVPDTGPVLSRSKNSKSKFNRLSRFDFAADAVSRQWTTCNPFVAFELLNINGQRISKRLFCIFQNIIGNGQINRFEVVFVTRMVIGSRLE